MSSRKILLFFWICFNMNRKHPKSLLILFCLKRLGNTMTNSSSQTKMKWQKSKFMHWAQNRRQPCSFHSYLTKSMNTYNQTLWKYCYLTFCLPNLVSSKILWFCNSHRQRNDRNIVYIFESDNLIEFSETHKSLECNT